MERFLYRLSKTEFASAFILKGALLFQIREAPERRPTRDIDFLAIMDNTPEAVERVVKVACNLDVESDGLLFDSASIDSILIKNDADYEGVRVKFRATLANARVAMQIDVEFGDTVSPVATVATVAEYPVLLDLEAPRIRIYPPETVIAEKAEAMVKLGAINSRMKDFYDIWWLSRQFDFKGSTLKAAVKATFENRGTDIVSFDELLDELLEESTRFKTQWRAFVNNSGLESTPKFEGVLKVIERLLSPVFEAILDESFRELGAWIAPEGWD